MLDIMEVRSGRLGLCGMNAAIVSKAVFKRRFRHLPKLPSRAFQGEEAAEVLRIKHRSKATEHHPD